MNLLYRIKRRLFIKIMTALGFGGMAAFCVTGCDSTPQNKDNPASVPSPEQSQKTNPQLNADSNVPPPAGPQEQGTPLTAPGDDTDADGIKTEEIKAEETKTDEVKAKDITTDDAKAKETAQDKKVSATPDSPSADPSGDKTSENPKPARKPRPEYQLTLYI